MKSAVFLSLVAGLASLPDVLLAEEGVPDPKALFKQLDTNGDGKLSSAEIPKEQVRLFERLIRQADENADGELSVAEFVKGHTQEASPNLPLNGLTGERGPGNLRQRFDKLDRNQDGKITLAEVPDAAKDRLKPLFERLKKDELTWDDFRRARDVGEAVREQDPEKLFAQLDTNRDGKLNQNDVLREGPRRMLQQALRRAGQSEDAELSKAEFVALMANRPQTFDAERGRRDSERPRGPLFFRRLDTDRNGRISKAELEQAGALLAELDANQDGELDPMEMMGPPPDDMEERTARRPALSDSPRRFFDRLDQNADGKVTAEEAPPFLKNRFDQLDGNQDGSLSPEELRDAAPRRRPESPEGRARPKRPEAE